MPYAGDPGDDGLPTGMNSVVGRDVFAYSLGYFNGDYSAINNTVALNDSRDKLWDRTLENVNNSGLFNGNISWMTTDLASLGTKDRTKGMQAMMYRYDQLHRITKGRSLTTYSATNGFTVRPTISAYDEDYTYDANGNILSLNRNDDAATLKDDFGYDYYTNSNKLKNVKATQTQNYEYDAIGNLIKDVDEGTIISWTPYGKIRTVHKGDSITVSYRYDAAGNRVEKKVAKDSIITVTNYLRDASGNVMSIYKDTVATEVPIYGSSRLGLYKGGVAEGLRILGKRNFELSNHLGNVLVVISDQVGFKQDSVWATVLSSSDYYPFGLEMKGRTLSDTTYRYGFNGKEKDNSFASTTDYDYGFRIYNPEIGKFLSTDPLTKKYAMLTPYQFASNTPITSIDLDGLESLITIKGSWWKSQINQALNDKDMEKATLLAFKAMSTTLDDISDPKSKAYARKNWNGNSPATYNWSEKNQNGLTVVFEGED
ncbi:MAG TPA: RHS repeat-associated core domain-containing protein, partial [Saprospiraceae bacterium]|nr:RHS repeat-associated core domain-containing protein [Saprospiraceae bacterium]